MVSAPHSEGAQVEFPGKEPGEKYRFHFRQHWVRLVPPFAKAAAWTLLLFFSSLMRFVGAPFDDTTRRFILIPLAVFFVFFQMQLMRRWYEYFLHVIVVSDTKVHRLKKQFLLMENQRSTELSSIKDTRTLQRGFMQPLLKFGTLVLDAPEGELPLHFTPDVTKMRDALMIERDHARPEAATGQLLQDVKSAVETLQPYTEPK
jgi:hypothetical protein